MAADGDTNLGGRRYRFVSAVQRRGRSRDQIPLLVWGYMRGGRPSESAGWVLLPSLVGIVWSAVVYLRYRLAYRAQWVVEVHRVDRGRESVGTVVVRDRATALRLIDTLCPLLPTLMADEVPQTLVGLQPPGSVR